MNTVMGVAKDTSIYVYKLVHDDGGAPCVHADELSLSICKPRIRTSAQIGDWIVGFGGKSVADLRGRLIYVAKVTSVEAGGAYYANPKYHQRPDCVYRTDGKGGYFAIDDPRFHGQEFIPHDLGAPGHYERARNLLSNTFVYFGRCKRPSEEGDLAGIMDIYDSLPRDFLKNHSEINRKRLASFIERIFRKYTERVYGTPTHADPSAPFNEKGGGSQSGKRCSR